MPILVEDWVRGAEFHNACRRVGVQGSHTAFLICACSARLDAPVFTMDRDFDRYREVLPIEVFQP